jgi:integrase
VHFFSRHQTGNHLVIHQHISWTKNIFHVKAVIGKQRYKNATKFLDVYAHDAFSKMLGIQWTPPDYKQKEILPFIPREAELDQLIASCKSKRMTIFLQTLKETFADLGEALKIRWIDVDTSQNTITINGTVTGHRPRQLQVSSKLIAMLNMLPKNSKHVFPFSYKTLVQCFMVLRRRTARRLQNPRLLKISFNTFRHWAQQWSSTTPETYCSFKNSQVTSRFRVH